MLFEFVILRRGEQSFVYAEPRRLRAMDAANHHAVQIIEQIIGQEFMTPHDWRDWSVEVRSERGEVAVVPFSDRCGPTLVARFYRGPHLPP